MAPRSEYGGHAESVTSHSAAASEGRRRQSRSFALGPVHEHLPEYPEWRGEERAFRDKRWEGERERDIYSAEVDEEDKGGVVEVENSEGKLLYEYKV